MLWESASAPFQSDSSAEPEDYAIPVSWEYVKSGLKSPDSADFGRIREHKIYTIKGKPNTWEVRGYVDSQNSYGAMIRSTYACQLEYVSGGGSNVADWKLLDLQVD